MGSQKPISKKAVDLLLQSQIVLSEIETNGIKIDVPYMQRQLEVDPLAKFDWDVPGGWKSMYEQYKDKTDKYPISVVGVQWSR